MKKKSRVLEILGVAEELLLNFDNYFARHPWVMEHSGLTGVQIKGSVWNLVNKKLIDQNLSLIEKPKTVLGLIQKPWDSQWRLVTFDIPEEKSSIRKGIRNSLYELGFRKFQRSVWVSPLPVDDFVKSLLVEINKSENFSVFVGKLLGENSRNLVRNLWETDRWQDKAEKLVSKIEDTKKVFTRKTKSEFWDLILDHPKVPLNLLPLGWPLKKMVKIFSKISRLI